MKKFVISLLAGAALLSSCDSAFDVEYTGNLSGSQAADMIEKDPEFLATYNSGLYTWMVTFATTYDGHDDFGYLSCLMLSDFMGEDIAFDGQQNWGVFDYQHEYGGAEYVRTMQFWRQFYTLINNANTIIDFYPAGQEPSSPIVKGYLGQAYAVRALSYLYLIMFYQDPVDNQGNFRTDAPAVPIVYASRDQVSPEVSYSHQGRAPMSAVMSHVDYNIEQARKYLATYSRTSKMEIDLSVANGIAARYYLYTQQWQKAADAANEAVKGYTLMTKDELLGGMAEINVPEVMWGFNHSTETSTVFASFFSHMSNDSPGYAGLAQPYKMIDKRLYEKIENSDFRKSWFNSPSGDQSGLQEGAKKPYAARKFGNVANWLQDYIYMRAAEMLLIKAESYARLGNTPEAEAALKTLMASRNPSWSKPVTVDEVLLQRRIELWGEGFGYYDLRRNGLGIDRTYSGSNHATWGRLKFAAHDTKWNFQIPQSEIRENPFINEEDQNPL